MDKRIEKSIVDNIIKQLDEKDGGVTSQHGERVGKIAKLIATELGESDEMCNDLLIAGKIHDAGKIRIDDSILNKNGKLTDDEYIARDMLKEK